MNLLARYVLSRYLAHLALVTGILAALYLAVDAPERLGDAWSAFLSRVPLVLTHVLPVAAAVALVSSFHGLRISGALDLLLSSGIPWRRILGPALAGGAIAAGLEAGLSLAGAPAALGAAAEDRARVVPVWILAGEDVLHLSPDGAVRAWRPGAGPVEPPSDIDVVRRDVESLATRQDPAVSTTPGLSRTAALAGRLGHDPRPEVTELWTRIALPCALAVLLAVCAVSVRRGRSTARSAGVLVLAIFVGWLCMAVATQLASSGAAPPWMIPAMPIAAVAALAASPLP